MVEDTLLPEGWILKMPVAWAYMKDVKKITQAMFLNTNVLPESA